MRAPSSTSKLVWNPTSALVSYVGMSIAENLKRIREMRGLSQPALAAKADVSQQLLSQIENGINTTTKKLPSIARALGVPMSELDPNFGIEPPQSSGVGVITVSRLKIVTDLIEALPMLDDQDIDAIALALEDAVEAKRVGSASPRADDQRATATRRRE